MNAKSPYDFQNGANKRTMQFYENVNKLGKVTIIGLGGGGDIALHLLRSGADEMDLIDFDTLDSGNLIRHVCGIEHVDKNKAEAVRDLLNNYNGGGAKIKSHNWNIFDESEKFENIVSESSVVIIATDTESSKHYTNEICVKHNIAAVYVGMYQNGCGGEVFTSIPGLSCLECLGRTSGRNSFLDEYQKSVLKKDCSSTRDSSALPGLGIDQSFLSAIAARKALEILVTKAGGKSLPKLANNYILWSLFGIGKIFPEHLKAIYSDIPKHSDCSICSQKGE
jgi:molybdopterin/thiamine biosynthesis adenylyltransferase